jgi:protein ImuB
LWLCVYLPALEADCLARSGQALAVIRGEGPRQLIVACSAAAGAAGIRPGMRAAAARALLPELLLCPHDPRRGRAALERLAAWGLQFTSRVHPAAPDTLWLEIGASLRLFGGLEALRGRLLEGLAAFGFRCETGIAPTPAAARCLARAGDTVPVRHKESLAGRLARLPLDAMGWPKDRCTALARAGLRTVGDCLRLPRDGLARRYGPGLVRDLDRMLGRLPEPLENWQPSECFRAGIDLPVETVSLALLEWPLRCLLEQLVGWLRGRDGAISRLQLALLHRQEPATVISLELLRPGRDAGHFQALLGERLRTVRLTAPVVGCRLRSDRMRPFVAMTGDFQRAAGDGEEWMGLIERLRARLGPAAVNGLETRPRHCPEAAWRPVEPGRVTAATAVAGRPLWLLAEPRPLRVEGGHPRHIGPLTLECGPERIETGWWEAEETRRDYYLAREPDGSRLWIFRDRRGWFLHGLFA